MNELDCFVLPSAVVTVSDGLDGVFSNCQPPLGALGKSERQLSFDREELALQDKTTGKAGIRVVVSIVAAPRLFVG